MKKRVYIAYTGGTIGMRKNKQGQYVPARGFLEKQMGRMAELKDPLMPEYKINEYNPLLDSSNMTPENWGKIAADIEKNYKKYDGFIILHGTDTMAYTASALAFMLENLNKPVIITGSQVPLCAVRNDARENIITSLIIASRFCAPRPIPEVCLYFGGKLLRGCRAVKVSSDGFEAFDSPNFPALGKVGVTIEINWDLIRERQAKDQKLTVQEIQEPEIAALRLFPGISAKVVSNILQKETKGLVLEAYGAGNGPTANNQFLDALKEAALRDVVMVACTQCISGRVDLSAYSTSLASAGVISGQDMTAEAALTKLFYLFSKGLPPERVKQEMLKNLRGELLQPAFSVD